MHNNVSWKKSLATAAWYTLCVLAAIVILSLIILWLIGWQWVHLFSAYWLVFLIILLFTFVLVIAIYKYPFQSNFYVLSFSAIILMMASLKTHPIGSSIRAYVDKYFDLTYFATSITILPFSLPSQQSIVAESNPKTMKPTNNHTQALAKD